MSAGECQNKGIVPEYIRYLLIPEHHQPPVAEVRLVQTHISYVVIAGDLVYKWKKPVNFGFVDFSNLIKRQFYCLREVELNRRLCPDIYLGTVAISRHGATFCLDGQGEVVEYGVKMRRLPEQGMLDRVITRGELGESHLETIVDILVPFYRRAQHGRRVRKNGRVEAVARNIANNYLQTRAFVGSDPLPADRYSRISSATTRFLYREELFAKRRRHNCIRDCHGDLYSHNICLDLDGAVHIFDCLEFNDGLRYIDVAADVAFFAMDLEYHGLPELSAFFVERFIDRYEDPGLVDLLDFYKCYRAFVRGKVGLLSADDPGMTVAAAQGQRQAATRYFQLAEEYALRL